MEYPYQLVAFLAHEPLAGEAIYGGEKGWYPQIALKRRFGLNKLSEEQLINKVEDFALTTKEFSINVKGVKKPNHMPVEVLEVEPTAALLAFHRNFIAQMKDNIVSKYADREGSNYYPHVTLEYWHKRLFDPAPFEHTSKQIVAFWLVKDGPGTDESFTLKKFKLRS